MFGKKKATGAYRNARAHYHLRKASSYRKASRKGKKAIRANWIAVHWPKVR